MISNENIIRSVAIFKNVQNSSLKAVLFAPPCRHSVTRPHFGQAINSLKTDHGRDQDLLLPDYFGDSSLLWRSDSGYEVTVSARCHDTHFPTEQPSAQPTEEPSAQPTGHPSLAPSEQPSVVPTELCSALRLTVQDYDTAHNGNSSEKDGGEDSGDQDVTLFDGIYTKQGDLHNGKDWWSRRTDTGTTLLWNGVRWRLNGYSMILEASEADDTRQPPLHGTDYMHWTVLIKFHSLI